MANRAEIVYGNSITQLLMKNKDFVAFLKKKMAGIWAWPPRWRQRVLGFKTQPKGGPPGGTFGSSVISKKIENLGPEYTYIFSTKIIGPFLPIPTKNHRFWDNYN